MREGRREGERGKGRKGDGEGGVEREIERGTGEGGGVARARLHALYRRSTMHVFSVEQSLLNIL